MTTAVVAGLLAGYGIAIPVGAVGAYLVALTARTGWRTGAGAALGVATADGLYALLAVLGGSALVPLLAPVMAPLRWASACVLVALAVRAAWTALRAYRAGGLAARRDGEHPMTPLRAYLTFLGITVLNPMTVIYFAALILATGPEGPATPPARTAFVLAALVASASWQLLLATGGALLGKGLTGPKGRLVTALVSSALIAGLAIHLVS
ncbi:MULTISPECIES: LysE/ArgO family amino acid transporter [Streptomyces]|uniref:LysE/ArgO family amino acid transporter n=1 Tax=Streptomyces TaxID=1883 RepID=UPI0013169444|nr:MULTISPECIES: LysE family transporter [Streptomyces]QGZ50213.1 LysE family transporter [Streptomyces sp. QHH-9511]GGU03288.1 lysine transporter LysE [Streptomyces lateritius]